VYLRLRSHHRIHAAETEAETETETEAEAETEAETESESEAGRPWKTAGQSPVWSRQSAA
jgi:hypothetical protein